MIIEFEDMPLNFCGHLIGSFSGRADVNPRLPEVENLWLYDRDGNEIELCSTLAFNAFQRRELERAILRDYAAAIDEERVHLFVNRPREYPPGQLLPSELR